MKQTLFQLFRYGVTTGEIPIYLPAMMAAEDWGCPPWEVMPGYATRRWWLDMWNRVKSIRAKAQERKIKK